MHTLVFRSLKRSHDMFISDNIQPPPIDEKRLVYFELRFTEVVKISCIDMFISDNIQPPPIDEKGFVYFELRKFFTEVVKITNAKEV